MKLKGISTVEQHIEKIVLAVFVVFAMVMLVLQLLREPNTVSIGNKTVTPATASDAVSELARQVNSQLESQTTPAIPKTPELEQEFVKLLSSEGELQPMKLVERWGDDSQTSVVTTDPGSGSGGDNLYYEPVPPAPAGVVAHVYEGTIDPVEPLRFPELAKLLPKAQPFDARFVSVEGTVDVAALREELKGEKEGRDPLPSSWWTGRTEIVDVELIRSTMKADGTWGPDEAVASLPGRFSMRSRVRDTQLAPKDLTDIMEKERSNREAIRRPSFYTLIAGSPWVSPSKAEAGSAAEARPARVDQLLRDMENYDREIKRLTDLTNPSAASPPQPAGGRPPAPGGRPGPGGTPPGRDRDAPPPSPSPRHDGSRADASLPVEWPEIPSDWMAQAGGKPSGPGGGGGRPEGPTPEEDKAAREERKRKAFEADLNKFKDRRDKAISELASLGFDEKGQRKAATSTSTDSGSTPEPMTSVLDQSTASVGVWAHDVTAKAGETYRYKLRVWIVNPFFGNASALAESQKPAATIAGLASAASEWTAPVTIVPQTQFFVTNAREAAPAISGAGRSEANADVEVYEFFYGYWRRGTAKLDPGDQVRATIELPSLPIYKVRLDDKGTPVVEAGGNADASRKVSASTFLLGVSRQAGLGNSGAFEVFMREASGAIGVRLPSADESDALRARLAASAEAGSKAVVANPGVGSGGPGGVPGLPPPGSGDDRDAPPGGSGLPGG